MPWVTVYDVRDGWTLWLSGGAAIVLLGAALFGVVSIRTGRSRTKKTRTATIVFSSCCVLFAVPAVAQFVADYTRRADLDGERFGREEGTVESLHIEDRFEDSPMYFRVSGRWFVVPDRIRRTCPPLNSETARVAFQSTPHQRTYGGEPAFTVLKLELAHGCNWGTST